MAQQKPLPSALELSANCLLHLTCSKCSQQHWLAQIHPVQKVKESEFQVAQNWTNTLPTTCWAMDIGVLPSFSHIPEDWQKPGELVPRVRILELRKATLLRTSALWQGEQSIQTMSGRAIGRMPQPNARYQIRFETNQKSTHISEFIPGSLSHIQRSGPELSWARLAIFLDLH